MGVMRYMEMQLDTKLEVVDVHKAKASIRIDIMGSGFTVTNILITSIRNETGGKQKITLPLMQIGSQKKPVIMLRGALKSTVLLALNEDYERLRLSGEQTLSRSRLFPDNFVYLSVNGHSEVIGFGASVSESSPI